jgi:hypothetical protein
VRIPERIKKIVTQKKSTAVLVISILLFLSAAASVMFVFRLIGNSRSSVPAVPVQKLVTVHPLILPPGPSLPEGYTTSRESRTKWTDEDADAWFSTPDRNTVDSLGKSNDALISDILGAAP